MKKLTLFLGLIFSLNAFSAGAIRSDKNAGFQIKGNGDPAPSLMSLDFSWSPKSFMRFSAGIGGYSTGIANAPRGIYNWTIAPLTLAGSQIIKPISFMFSWLLDGLDQILLHGKVKTHLRYNEYWQGHDLDYFQTNYIKSKSIFTYGGMLNLYVPDWSFSPTAGIGWAHFDSSTEAFGLSTTSGSHLYYQAGLSWMTAGGVEINGFYDYCPHLEGTVCGIGGGLGFFF